MIDIKEHINKELDFLEEHLNYNDLQNCSNELDIIIEEYFKVVDELNIKNLDESFNLNFSDDILNKLNDISNDILKFSMIGFSYTNDYKILELASEAYSEDVRKLRHLFIDINEEIKKEFNIDLFKLDKLSCYLIEKFEQRYLDLLKLNYIK